jgi:hypothetical protein
MNKHILLLTLLLPLICLTMQVPQAPAMVLTANIDFDDDAPETNIEADTDFWDDYSVEPTAIG